MPKGGKKEKMPKAAAAPGGGKKANVAVKK